MGKKRIIVCGARDYTDYRRVESSLREERELIELCINGGAKGADLFADSACSVLRIPKERMDAKWREQGLGAGPIRNQKMLQKLKEYLGEKQVWAFHDDLEKSKGTANMISLAIQAGIAVRLYGIGPGWTDPSKNGKIVLCQQCGGEKLLPRLLAYKIRCKADFHVLAGTIQLDIEKNKG
jgi:hypothetical protein